MRHGYNFGDAAQQALGFLIEQASHIETQVYQVQYPEILYPSLIPVDSSANEWAKSVTFFSIDKAGQADWFHHAATDMRIADVARTKFEVGLSMGGIGYQYTLEELGQAMLIPGTNLTNERADAARRAAMEFIDDIALNGNDDKGFEGFLNNTDVTQSDAAGTGTAGSSYWTAKTGDQMIADVNDALTGVYTESRTIEMADTVLLPIKGMTLLANTRLSSTLGSALMFLKQNNVYTAQTGRPLEIRGVRGLDAADHQGGGRMVVYRKDPQVVKLHLPMPHRFLPVYQQGPMVFMIPGIFRMGGVEIRRPGAVRYVDKITDPGSAI